MNAMNEMAWFQNTQCSTAILIHDLRNTPPSRATQVTPLAVVPYRLHHTSPPPHTHHHWYVGYTKHIARYKIPPGHRPAPLGHLSSVVSKAAAAPYLRQHTYNKNDRTSRQCKLKEATRGGERKTIKGTQKGSV